MDIKKDCSLPKNWFREWRVHKGLSQEELGQIVGLSGAQISRIESGMRIADLLYLHRFALVMGCPHYTMPLLGPPDPWAGITADELRLALQLTAAVRAEVEQSVGQPSGPMTHVR